MIDLKTFEACPECQYRIKFGRCPIKHKHQCPFKQVADIVRYETGEFQCLPDEFFFAVLRRRGWHGELKQTRTITV